LEKVVPTSMPNKNSLRVKPDPLRADANEFRKVGGIWDKQALAWKDPGPQRSA
jgi:hypothetical protein